MRVNPPIPPALASGLICLVLGTGAGMAINQMYGPFFQPPKQSPNRPEDMGGGARQAKGDDGPAAKEDGKEKAKGKAKGKAGMGGGGRGPSARAQLIQLVTKLDQLTAKPLSISLSAEQKAKLGEQLAGLSEMEQLTDDEATKRMTAILEIVKADRETLEAAGVVWPGPRSMAPPLEMPNLFKGVEAGKRLKSLQERVGGK